MALEAAVIAAPMPKPSRLNDRIWTHSAAPALARDSLDGALIAAESLPDALAAPLVSLAQSAFDSAFVTVMIGVVALLGAASVGIALSTRRAR